MKRAVSASNNRNAASTYVSTATSSVSPYQWFQRDSSFRASVSDIKLEETAETPPPQYRSKEDCSILN